ncbi:APC family permease [Luteipulveratus sp. YIM 133132]|uniref:APC family permease n=1 Tax=Luteipulveratus flavus TaxID=3031728 RepID=UPI0023AF93ED|nr:APC family permease [Luteipulveratus sp. YIM 133132]MDE9366408.1 APC family permease [Luteipulveratus sp. YIM 133132]
MSTSTSTDQQDPDQAPETATEAATATAEKAKLQRHFGRADIFFFLVCTLFGIDGLGTLATQGGAGFSWLLVCLVLFAVPSAMILAELGAAYTDEGGPYVWTRMAFGRAAGAVNNFFYWVTNPVWMGGTLVATAASGLLVFFGTGGDATSKALLYGLGIPFIWAGVLFAVLSFRVGKWIATIGAYARFALMGLFLVVIALYAAQHGVHGIGAGDFAPSYSSFVALVPLILFSMVGFELPSAAGEEMENAAEDVPAGIAKSVITTGLLYGLPVLGILLVLPADQATGLAGFPDALKQALTVLGGEVHTGADGTVTSTLSGLGLVAGWAMGILIALVAFTSGLTWIMGSDRTLAVSCYDGAGPRSLGVFSSRFGTPLRVNVLSGLVSTVVLVATVEITSGDAYKLFTAALSLAISTTLISYLGIFPAALVLRRRDPDTPRPYRAPALPLLTFLSCAAIVFCTVQVLFPGLGDSWFAGDYLPEQWTYGERYTFLLTELVPLVLFVALGLWFWWAGRAHTRRLGAPLSPVE